MSYLLSIYSTGLCEGLRPRIIEIAKKGRSPGGSVAVEALVALKVPRESQLYKVHTLSPDGHCGKVLDNARFSNILGYLGNTLPPLDAEIGSISQAPSDNTSALSPVLQANGERHVLCASFLRLTHVLVGLTKKSCASLQGLSSHAMTMNALRRP